MYFVYVVNCHVEVMESNITTLPKQVKVIQTAIYLQYVLLHVYASPGQVDDNCQVYGVDEC